MTNSDNTEAVQQEIQTYLQERIKAPVALDLDLFASGTITSIFAMELVVYLEKTYSIAIIGNDLKLANFRTVQSMAALVTRLSEGAAVSG
jgi:methoxymalonate biosynthesis acyl carrier protein